MLLKSLLGGFLILSSLTVNADELKTNKQRTLTDYTLSLIIVMKDGTVARAQKNVKDHLECSTLAQRFLNQDPDDADSVSIAAMCTKNKKEVI